MFDKKLAVHCTIGILLLGGVVLDRVYLHPISRNADDYHKRVLDAARAMPYSVGQWLSRDEPPQEAAEAMLRPNAIMGRHYVNLSNNLQASFLLVQCKDARDLIGHYPPVCYVANGYQLIQQKEDPRTLRSHGSMPPLAILGMTYEFSSAKLVGKGSMNVFDIMILPNGQTAPDMNGVYSIARDRRQRHFGAAQIQILTDASMSEEKRSDVILTLLDSARPLIEEIRSGVIQ